jgi:hypothetical protein
MTLMLMSCLDGLVHILIKSTSGYPASKTELLHADSVMLGEECCVCHKPLDKGEDSNSYVRANVSHATGYCLPTYEDEVNWTSKFYSYACKECHDEACAAYEAALKYVEDPANQLFEERT